MWESYEYWVSLAHLRHLSKPSYPDDSKEIGKHNEMRAFSARLLDENNRLENKKVTRMSLADASKKIILDAIYRLEIKQH